jgi:hypothetical protein
MSGTAHAHRQPDRIEAVCCADIHHEAGSAAIASSTAPWSSSSYAPSSLERADRRGGQPREQSSSHTVTKSIAYARVGPPIQRLVIQPWFELCDPSQIRRGQPLMQPANRSLEPRHWRDPKPCPPRYVEHTPGKRGHGSARHCGRSALIVGVLPTARGLKPRRCFAAAPDSVRTRHGLADAPDSQFVETARSRSTGTRCAPRARG